MSNQRVIARGAAIKPVARLALVSVAVASALWLMPASVAIASWKTSGPVRVAFLPPLARFWITFAITIALVAAAARAWRAAGKSLEEFARLTAPLSLLLLWAVPFVPWAADYAPALLVFAGPMRWAIAAVAAGGIAASLWRSRRHAASIDRRVLVAVAFVVYAAMGARFAQQVGFTGDEPHYLVIAHSLLADRDLDIANNHEQRDYESFFPSTLGADYLKRGRHGEIFSIHAPGLPAMLVPAYAVGGAIGAVVFVAMLAALASLAIFDLASRLTRPTIALATWAGVCFSVPFVPHAWLIYPEIVGALIVAHAASQLWEPPQSGGRAAINGLMLAALPWLHTKFVVLLAALAVFQAVRLWPRIKLMIALATPLVVSLLLWLLSFYWMYGVLDPRIPYGTSAQTIVAGNVPRGVLGLLFDQKFGLLMYAPLYILTIPGARLLLRDREHRWPAIGLLVTTALFLVSTTRFYMWWGGSSAPARFLVPVVPLLAPFVAIAIARLDGVLGRALVVSTVVCTFSVAAVALASHGERFLYNAPHGLAFLVRAIQGAAPLDLLLPTFTEEDWRSPLLALLPWLAGLVVASGTAFVLVRARATRSPYWTAVAAACVFVVCSGIAAARPPVAVRALAATRGQVALLAAYDPSRFHAVNASRGARLTDDQVRAFATVDIRRESGDDAAPLPPIELPEGAYQARIWFSDGVSRPGDLDVVTSGRALLARGGGGINPKTVAFELPITASVQTELSDPSSRAAVARAEIVPTSVVPRSLRTVESTVAVERIGEGSLAGLLAYVDERSYPERGVFWTRDTERATVVIVKDSRANLRLILHVGPPGGRVDVDVDRKRFSFDLGQQETRDLLVDLAPGTTRTTVSVRADRAFVPAAIEPGNADRRSLGCQVRPVLF